MTRNDENIKYVSMLPDDLHVGDIVISRHLDKSFVITYDVLILTSIKKRPDPKPIKSKIQMYDFISMKTMKTSCLHSSLKYNGFYNFIDVEFGVISNAKHAS